MKNRVKSVICILISLILAFGLIACGTETSQPNPPVGSSETESKSETETESTTESETVTESETATESEKETETETESEKETETESETESEIEQPSYTYTDMDKTMYAINAVNVRDLPSTDGTKIGAIGKGESVQVTGKCNETNWYRISYAGGVAYVAASYFSEEKPKEEVPPENTDTKYIEGDVSNTNPDADEIFGKMHGTVLVIGKAGYETIGYSDSSATDYAQIITDLANALDGYSKVYSIPIPKSSGIQYDDAYQNVVHKTNQGTTIDKLLGKMGDKVVKVDVFETMWEHRNEYLYFRTDHHWTQTGAYYAYTEFCKAKGITPKLMNEYKQVVAHGYVGSYYNYSKQDGVAYAPFKRYPDTVYTYSPISNATMTITDRNGKSYNWPIVSDLTGKKGTYNCFIGGDNPYSIIKNKDVTDGSSCIVVKESFGNAFVPLLVDQYETVHIIDARYWKGDLVTFAKENNVQDVIMINNLSAIFSKDRRADLKKIIY